MFTTKTVFILGAGASWHYGYPTGEGLVAKVIDKARQIAKYFDGVAAHNISNALTNRPDFVGRHEVGGAGFQMMRVQWQRAAAECKALAERLEQVNPLVIDYFLGQSKSLQEVGKLIVALVLLECEAQHLNSGVNLNHRDTMPNAGISDLRGYKDRWVRFIVHELVNGAETISHLVANDVTFVTFNYDASFEWELNHGLSHIEACESGVGDFFAAHPIIHVYGKLRNYPGEFTPIGTGLLPFDPRSYQTDDRAPIKQATLNDVLNAAYAASQLIRTIGPSEKSTDEVALTAARAAVRDAQCVYLLGYGFDERNSKLLGLDKNLLLGGRKSRRVLFTNYGDVNRVNKRASNLLFGDIEHFGPGNPFFYKGGNFYCEKSSRDVYRALEVDFDPV